MRKAASKQVSYNNDEDLIADVEKRTARRTGRSDRKDAPPLRSTVRGDKQLALAVASNDRAFDLARASYTSEWRSRGDTSEYYIKAWHDLHNAHYDGIRRPRTPALPLTPELIHTIGTLINIAGYKGAK